MSLWVTSAIEKLSAPGAVLQDLGSMWGPIESCQDQISRAHEIGYLHNVGGAVHAYRSACESALVLLKKAHAVKVPFLGMQPGEFDSPQQHDSWTRQRKRRDDALEEKKKHLAAAVEHLQQAEKIAREARENKPLAPGESQATREQERRQPAAAGGKK